MLDAGSRPGGSRFAGQGPCLRRGRSGTGAGGPYARRGPWVVAQLAPPTVDPGEPSRPNPGPPAWSGRSRFAGSGGPGTGPLHGVRVDGVRGSDESLTVNDRLTEH
jgi:hypothetical protein